MLVAATDAPGVVAQLRHWLPEHAFDWQSMAAGITQAPLTQLPWSVVFPAVQEAAGPHLVVEDLLVALHTGFPLEQSIAPVWHWASTPSVQEAPGVQALHVPVLSQTPAALPEVQAVATGTVLQVPVEQEWHVAHVVAQQMPETQWPCVHWLSAEQALPSATVAVQAPPAPQ